MSRLSYSAQLRVRKRIGDPYSRTMHFHCGVESSTVWSHAHSETQWRDWLQPPGLCNGQSVHELTHRLCMLLCTLEHTLHTCCNFTHLLLSWEIEDVLIIFAESPILIQQVRFGKFTC